MKKIIVSILLCMPMVIIAGTWEIGADRLDSNRGVKSIYDSTYSRYLTTDRVSHDLMEGHSFGRLAPAYDPGTRHDPNIQNMFGHGAADNYSGNLDDYSDMRLFNNTKRGPRIRFGEFATRPTHMNRDESEYDLIQDSLEYRD